MYKENEDKQAGVVVEGWGCTGIVRPMFLYPAALGMWHFNTQSVCSIVSLEACLGGSFCNQ